ncbi:MAG: RNA-binding protein [Gloeobacterales cyanobacterium]
MTERVYVGNLSETTTAQEIEGLFTQVGTVVSVKLVTDHKTGKCRGFGFVTIEGTELAQTMVEKFNGHDFQGKALKVEIAQAKAPETSESGGRTNRPRGKSSSNGGARQAQPRREAVTSSSQDTPSGIDPRWAALLAVKEKLELTKV